MSVLPGASGVTQLTDLDHAQRMRLLHAVDHLDAQFDTLIVDTPAGIGSNAAFFASAVQDVLIVATPEPTSLTDAYAMIKVLNRTYGVDRVGMVLNEVDSMLQTRCAMRIRKPRPSPVPPWVNRLGEGLPLRLLVHATLLSLVADDVRALSWVCDVSDWAAKTWTGD